MKRLKDFSPMTTIDMFSSPKHQLVVTNKGQAIICQAVLTYIILSICTKLVRNV